MMIDLINTPRRLRKPGLLSAAEASELCADLVADRPFITGGYRRPASMRQCALRSCPRYEKGVSLPLLQSPRAYSPDMCAATCA